MSGGGTLPEPLVAAEVDLRDFPDMMLDVRKLRDSRFSARVSGEAFRAGVLLWCAAWHQVPCGSVPDDDFELSTLAGFGRVVSEWRVVRDEALQGFVKCSDGRLYHETVCEKANAAWLKRLEHFYGRALERFRKDHKDVPQADRPKPLSFTEWNDLRISAAIPMEKADATPDTTSASADLPPEKKSFPAETVGGVDGIPAEIALKGEGEGEIRESLKRNTTTSDEVVRPQPSADGPAQLGLDGSETRLKAGPYEPPDCPHLAILDLWAEVLPAMPRHKPTQWKGARTDHLRARWRERAAEKRWASVDDGLADMRGLFAFIGESQFLTGRTTPRDGKPPFLVTLEWVAKPGNWAKVVEGNFHRELTS